MLILSLILIINLNAIASDDNAVKGDLNLNHGLFPLSIIHINDLHARFEETNLKSMTCRDGEQCIGGYARVVATVKRLLEEHKHENPIYLNAGDNYQGSIWYNTYKWNVTSYFLNLLPADAITIGNHEFDDRVAGLVPFLDTIKSPVVVSNLDISKEPSLFGKFNKSIVIERQGRKIGIIGALTSVTQISSNVDNVIFKNEIESIRAEVQILKIEGVNIIIALTHCGLKMDRMIAEVIEDIDVIVGGHSHTFLYSGLNPPGPDIPADTYPVVVAHKQDRKTLIVQASCFTKYVGNLLVNFDDSGNVVSWTGNPIYMDSTVTQDPAIIEELQPWKYELDELGRILIGTTSTELSKTECRFDQCVLGCLITDAFYNAFKDEVPKEIPLIAIIQAGGMRTSIAAGNISHADIITALPYSSRLNTMDLRGEIVREVFEYSASQSYLTNKFIGKVMLQVSGARVTYKFSNPTPKRVVKIEVFNRNLNIYEPLNNTRIYKFVLSSFLSFGGDGYTMFSNYGTNLNKTDQLDIDVVEQYMKELSPIEEYDINTNRRIIVL